MSKRWDRFTTRELQALDEYFRNVAGIRPHSEDIRKLAGEVAAPCAGAISCHSVGPGSRSCRVQRAAASAWRASSLSLALELRNENGDSCFTRPDPQGEVTP